MNSYADTYRRPPPASDFAPQHDFAPFDEEEAGEEGAEQTELGPRGPRGETTTTEGFFGLGSSGGDSGATGATGGSFSSVMSQFGGAGSSGSSGSATSSSNLSNPEDPFNAKQTAMNVGVILGLTLGSIFGLLAHIHMGACIIFFNKVAEAEVLPSDSHYEPYITAEDEARKDNRVVLLRDPNNESVNQELNFSYDYERGAWVSNKVVIDPRKAIADIRQAWLHAFSDSENVTRETSVFGFFVHNIFVDTVCLCFAIFEGVFKSTNKMFGEALTIYLGSFIMSIVFFVLMIVSHIGLIFYFFYHIPILLTTKDLQHSDDCYNSTPCNKDKKEMLIKGGSRSKRRKQTGGVGAGDKGEGDKGEGGDADENADEGAVPKFVNNENFETFWTRWGWRVVVACIVILAFFPFAIIVAPIYSIYMVFSIFYVVASVKMKKIRTRSFEDTGGAVGNLDDEARYGDYTMTGIFFDILCYRRRIIMILTTLFLASGLVQVYGAMSLLYLLVGVVVVYFFGDMFGNVYAKYEPIPQDHFSKSNVEKFAVKRLKSKKARGLHDLYQIAAEICVKMDEAGKVDEEGNPLAERMRGPTSTFQLYVKNRMVKDQKKEEAAGGAAAGGAAMAAGLMAAAAAGGKMPDMGSAIPGGGDLGKLAEGEMAGMGSAIPGGGDLGKMAGGEMAGMGSAIPGGGDLGKMAGGEMGSAIPSALPAAPSALPAAPSALPAAPSAPELPAVPSALPAAPSALPAAPSASELPAVPSALPAAHP